MADCKLCSREILIGNANTTWECIKISCVREKKKRFPGIFQRWEISFQDFSEYFFRHGVLNYFIKRGYLFSYLWRNSKNQVSFKTWKKFWKESYMSSLNYIYVFMPGRERIVQRFKEKKIFRKHSWRQKFFHPSVLKILNRICTLVSSNRVAFFRISIDIFVDDIF